MYIIDNFMKVSFGSFFSFTLHQEGLQTVLVCCGILFASIVLFGFNGFSIFLIFANLFVISFFRDPPRVVPKIENAIVSPADGVITSFGKSKLPAEIKNGDEKEYTKISIFMSPFNVHVNRMPVEGVVTKIQYIKGKFVNVTTDKDSKDNERNIIEMKTKDGHKIVFTQIAGFLARRIVCDAKVNDSFKMGDKFGIIKFGSRADVYFDDKYEVRVANGQTMVGGETILAKLKK